MRSPLYEAKADPDIYFFGFDLTIDAGQGRRRDRPERRSGWFFVIKERPGEPRFGLELEPSSATRVFDQLTWDDALPGGAPGQFLPAGSLASVALDAPAAGDRSVDQHDDDAGSIAAAVELGALGLPAVPRAGPGRVHADEMLR